MLFQLRTQNAIVELGDHKTLNVRTRVPSIQIKTASFTWLLYAFLHLLYDLS